MYKMFYIKTNLVDWSKKFYNKNIVPEKNDWGSNDRLVPRPKDFFQPETQAVPEKRPPRP